MHQADQTDAVEEANDEAPAHQTMDPLDAKFEERWADSETLAQQLLVNTIGEGRADREAGSNLNINLNPYCVTQILPLSLPLSLNNPSPDPNPNANPNTHRQPEFDPRIDAQNICSNPNPNPNHGGGTQALNGGERRYHCCDGCRALCGAGYTQRTASNRWYL